ncbi:hypothetical protein RRG08_004836 [Elysia crispata]|uniref:Uncharacterized protein n=1 Tax=Elysia crispata TaxID=231223 RepID=A0AAE0Y4D0_9GAST|nr:hypothetical protein RRG08_004836 [Elysia crispata]
MAESARTPKGSTAGTIRPDPWSHKSHRVATIHMEKPQVTSRSRKSHRVATSLTSSSHKSHRVATGHIE